MMNKTIQLAFLAVLSSTGCIVYDRDYTPNSPQYPGDATFTWSFAGQTCSDLPQIRSVHVGIPGETLQNDGVYPCKTNGHAGIVLHDFAPGTYSFTLTALGYSNEQLYVGSGTFTVNGDVRKTVDLTPVGLPTSYAYLNWRFPENSASANPTCAEAGVSFVDVKIDDGAVQRFNCSVGFGEPGAQTPYLMPGSHSIELVALSATGYPYYRKTGTLTTFSGDPISATYQLNWGVGGVAVRWQLANGALSQTCAEAGVTKVYVNFQDSTGQFIYGPSGDEQPCNQSVVFYDYLLPGVYKVFVSATGFGGAGYLSSAQSPPLVSVQAGHFAEGTQDAVSVSMFKTP